MRRKSRLKHPTNEHLSLKFEELMATNSEKQSRGTSGGVADEMFSAHHCLGQMFRNDEWKSRSCMYANLCLDQQTNKWIYYRDAADFVPKIPQSYLHQDHSRPSNDPKPEEARGHIQSDFAVSLSPLGQLFDAYNWAFAEGNNSNGWKDGSVGAGYRWAPNVITGPIPKEATMMSADQLYVLYQSYIGHNIGHLIFDEFLPWFTLQTMFGLDPQQRLQPISYIRDMNWPAEESW
jgi:hypothetical protein